MEDSRLRRIAKARETVKRYYEAAIARNDEQFEKGSAKATAEYIFRNQREDAIKIVHEFYTNKRRAIGVTKKTKVGADGLMIEIAKLMTTHSDDDFVIDHENVRIITGMSNKSWEDDMKEKAPECFRKHIYHHGKLADSDLKGLKNALIIIDEIDTGDGEGQVLHKTLHDAGLWNIKYMIEHNLRFVFISATMLKQSYKLFQWGDILQMQYNMEIPDSYIGHKQFLERGLLAEYYPLKTDKMAEQWINEDILENYKTDYRVHIVRIKTKTESTVLQTACETKKIIFKLHTSEERLTKEEEKEFFSDPLTNHVVLAVKGLLRRANLIPNAWKLRIGATHEYFTKKPDYNVQIQGLPGRMTGYWKKELDAGHKTGPHRTSLKAITEYEKVYEDPFGLNSYISAGFTKKDGHIIKISDGMLSHVAGVVPIDLPTVPEKVVDIKTYRTYSDEKTAKSVCMKLYGKFTKVKLDEKGFAKTSHHATAEVMSLKDAIELVPKSYGLEKDDTKEGRGRRTYFPCYTDITDKSTLRFVVIIHPDVDAAKIADIDAKSLSPVLTHTD